MHPLFISQWTLHNRQISICNDDVFVHHRSIILLTHHLEIRVRFLLLDDDGEEPLSLTMVSAWASFQKEDFLVVFPTLRARHPSRLSRISLIPEGKLVRITSGISRINGCEEYVFHLKFVLLLSHPVQKLWSRFIADSGKSFRLKMTNCRVLVLSFYFLLTNFVEISLDIPRLKEQTQDTLFPWSLWNSNEGVYTFFLWFSRQRHQKSTIPDALLTRDYTRDHRLWWILSHVWGIGHCSCDMSYSPVGLLLFCIKHLLSWFSWRRKITYFLFLFGMLSRRPFLWSFLLTLRRIP